LLFPRNVELSIDEREDAASERKNSRNGRVALGYRHDVRHMDNGFDLAALNRNPRSCQIRNQI
jgi:hypothetical protein